MATSASKKVIYAALIGNGLISITKFVASMITGSSAMLSEAIHSLVDTGNQGLLLYGIKRSKRAPDANHPFGYGMELYFWSFIVAILIFSVGAGVSLYEGIHKIINPQPVTDAYINYIVLSVAIIFEAGAWYIAYKEFNKTRGGRSYLRAVRQSKDPAIFTVLFEDTAAMMGLLAAFVGVACSQIYDIAELDGAASVVIGIILAGTAMFLAYESKGLLIGESAHSATVDGVRTIVSATPGVSGVNEVLSMHLSPKDVLLNISADFDDGLPSEEVERTITQMEASIKQTYPAITRVFIEIQGRKAHFKAKPAVAISKPLPDAE